MLQTNHSTGPLPIVIGDFNKEFSDTEEDGLKRLLSTCNIVNAFQVLTDSTPSSRQNHRQVFHVLTHPQVLKFINKIGTLGDDVGFSTSDHIPFFLDLDHTIFSVKINTVLPQVYQTLKSTNPANVTNYIEYVLE